MLLPQDLRTYPKQPKHQYDPSWLEQDELPSWEHDAESAKRYGEKVSSIVYCRQSTADLQLSSTSHSPQGKK